MQQCIMGNQYFVKLEALSDVIFLFVCLSVSCEVYGSVYGYFGDF